MKRNRVDILRLYQHVVLDGLRLEPFTIIKAQLKWFRTTGETLPGSSPPAFPSQKSATCLDTSPSPPPNATPTYPPDNVRVAVGILDKLEQEQQESGGVPLAIRGLLEHASKHPEIDCKDLRSYQHDAGVRYLDMTPALVLIIIGFIAMRYVSRGMGEMEMLVLSGVASVLFYGVSILIRRLR